MNNIFGLLLTDNFDIMFKLLTLPNFPSFDIEIKRYDRFTLTDPVNFMIINLLDYIKPRVILSGFLFYFFIF